MKNHRYRVKEIKIIGGEIIDLKLASFNGGDVFDFKPGQYAMIMPVSGNKISDGFSGARPFSIASSPLEKKYLQFGIRISGNFTKNLVNLREGDEVMVSGPYGDFIFDENIHKEAVFLAGGVGVTPFVSSIRYATEKNLANKLTLIYSVRNLEVAIFAPELLELSKINLNFKFVLVVVNQTIPEGYDNAENKMIDLETFKKYLNSASNKTFFMCGPLPFMEAMDKNLVFFGASDDQINKEQFSISPSISWKKNFKIIALTYGTSFVLFLILLFFVSQQKVEGTIKFSISAINDLTQDLENQLNLQKQLFQQNIASESINEKVDPKQNFSSKETVSVAATSVPVIISAPTPTPTFNIVSSPAPAQVQAPSPAPVPKKSPRTTVS